MIKNVFFGAVFRYFALQFSGWVALCLFGLSATITLIQTIELFRRVSVLQHIKTDVNLVIMAILNLPSVIETTLPFAMLAGSMLCFASWNRSNEFVVLRCFGQSIWSALSPALVSALVIGLLCITIVNPISSVTSKRYESQMVELFGDANNDFSFSASGIWLRDVLSQGKLIIHGDSLNYETASIINPIVYLYGEDVHVKATYRASVMQLTKKGWILENTTRWQNDGQETELGKIILPSNLVSLDLLQSGLAPHSIAIYQLPRFIKSIEQAGIPATDYRLHLSKILSTPVLLIGISMLAARITLRNVSRGRQMWLFTRGTLLATAIFIFSYFMQVLGASLRVPAEFAAWTPAITILLIGAITLARSDES
jgi:lipopolysaccharide export system permease protein